MEQRMGSADPLLPKETAPTDEPLNLDQVAMEFDKAAPPPYKENNLPLRGSRVITRHRIVLGCRVMRYLIVAFILFMFARTVPVVIRHYMKVNQLRRIQREVVYDVRIVKDIDNIPPEYEGKLIYARGPLSVPTPVMNIDECGISPYTVKLRRISNRAIPKSEFQPNFVNETLISYDLDNEDVCKVHELPSEKYMYWDEKSASIARIGALELGSQTKETFINYNFLTTKLLISSSEARIVEYFQFGRNGTEYSVMGQLVNGTTQPYDMEGWKFTSIEETETSPYDMIEEYINDRINENSERNWFACFEIIFVIPTLASLYCLGHIEAMWSFAYRDRSLSV